MNRDSHRNPPTASHGTRAAQVPPRAVDCTPQLARDSELVGGHPPVPASTASVARPRRGKAGTSSLRLGCQWPVLVARPRLRVKAHGLKVREGGKGRSRCCEARSSVTRRPHLAPASSWVFSAAAAAIAPGSVTSIANFFLCAVAAAGQVRSGQVYYSAEVQDHESQAKNKRSGANRTRCRNGQRTRE